MCTRGGARVRFSPRIGTSCSKSPEKERNYNGERIINITYGKEKIDIEIPENNILDIEIILRIINGSGILSGPGPRKVQGAHDNEKKKLAGDYIFDNEQIHYDFLIKNFKNHFDRLKY